MSATIPTTLHAYCFDIRKPDQAAAYAEHLRAVRKMTGRRNSTFALGQTRVGLGAVTII